MPKQNTHILKTGYQECRRVTRHWAKSFYFASLFLPRDRRDAAYAVYAVCRDCDNAVDHPDQSGPAAALERNQQRIAAVYQSAPMTDPVWAAFQDTVRRFQIPRRYFDDLLAGMAMDLAPAHYPDFPALSVYCYRAAGVVGLIMLRILGYQDPAAEQCAVDLGIAMQLTNILRDIQEDYQRGRIYLPQEDLHTFKIQEQTLSEGRVDPRWQSLLAFEIDRARAFYQQADQGIPLITGRRCRLVVCVMSAIYAAILTAIERQGYNVFARRARVPLPQKLWLLIRVLADGHYHRSSPQTVTPAAR